MALSDNPSGQRHSGEHRSGEQGYTSREQRGDTQDYQSIQAGRGFLSEATEATEDLATTAVRGVVGVGENIIQGIGRLATDGVVEVSRLLVTAAGGLRGAIGTIVTGRPPQDIPWLNVEGQYQGYRQSPQRQSQRQGFQGTEGYQGQGTQGTIDEGRQREEATRQTTASDDRPPTI